jgi:hypothetical protein
MEAIKSKRGGRRPGAGRKKGLKRSFRDAIDGIKVEELVKSLEQWAKGKEVICPHCNERTGAYTADTVALQSAIELLNRRLGKPPQSIQLDVTQTIQLSADQIDALIERFQIAQRALMIPAIEGEYKKVD